VADYIVAALSDRHRLDPERAGPPQVGDGLVVRLAWNRSARLLRG